MPHLFFFLPSLIYGGSEERKGEAEREGERKGEREKRREGERCISLFY